MPAGIKANSDGSAAIQVGGTDVITLTSGGAATFVTSPTTVQAGTAAAPSITFSGDTNTGIYSPGADQVAIATGGTKRFEVDANGNAGLGVTPSAWSGFTALQIQNGALFTDSTSFRSIMNGYYNGTNWIYSTSNAATRYEQVNGIHRWFNAASGTAGNTITFTQVMAVEGGKSLALEGATSQSGTGITFPATQSASTNANTLDDYEEGSWTPTDTSGAGLTLTAITSARYVKIGKRVFCDLEVGYPTTANTADISIGGLPYASANETTFSSGVCMNDANLNLWSFVNQNTTNVVIYKQAAVFTTTKNNEVSGKALYISIEYNAAN